MTPKSKVIMFLSILILGIVIAMKPTMMNAVEYFKVRNETIDSISVVNTQEVKIPVSNQTVSKPPEADPIRPEAREDMIEVYKTMLNSFQHEERRLNPAENDYVMAVFAAWPPNKVTPEEAHVLAQLAELGIEFDTWRAARQRGNDKAMLDAAERFVIAQRYIEGKLGL